MRFDDPEEEASFYSSQEQDLLAKAFAVYVTGFVAFGLSTLVVLHPGSYDTQIEWDGSDPRLLTGLAYFAETLLCGGMIAMCRLWSKCARLAPISLEWCILASCVMGHSVHILGSQFVTPLISAAESHSTFGYSVLESELLMLITAMAMMFAFSVLMPIRTHLLCPIMMLVTISTALLSYTVGTGFFYLRIWKMLIFVMSSVFSIMGASAKEQNMRNRWSASQRVETCEHLVETVRTELVEAKTIAVGLEAVAQQFCDLVVTLDSDARFINDDGGGKAFFGEDVEGLRFTDFVPEEESSRFRRLLSYAGESGVPQVTQMTVKRRWGEGPTELLAVDMRRDCQRRYIIGLSVSPLAPLVDDLAEVASGPPPGGVRQDMSGEISWALSLTADGTHKPDIRSEKGVQTQTSWATGGDGFVCLACALPPRPPAQIDREVAAIQQLNANRQVRTQRLGRQASKESIASNSEEEEQSTRLAVRRPAVAQSYDGLWVCTQVSAEIPRWFRALMIRGGEVVDGAGCVEHLTLVGQKVRVQSAELRVVSGGELMLTGRTGLGLRFRAMPGATLRSFCSSTGWYIPGIPGTEDTQEPSASVFMRALSKWLAQPMNDSTELGLPACVSRTGSRGSSVGPEKAGYGADKFDGYWVLMDVASKTPEWLLSFEVSNGAAVDGEGDVHILELAGRHVMLNEGVLDMEGDFMVRIGRKGRRLYYERRTKPASSSIAQRSQTRAGSLS